MLGPGYAPTNNVNGQPLPNPYKTKGSRRVPSEQSRTAVEGEVLKYKNTRKIEKWSKKYISPMD